MEVTAGRTIAEIELKNAVLRDCLNDNRECRMTLKSTDLYIFFILNFFKTKV